MVIKLLFSFLVLIASTGYGGIITYSPCDPGWQPIRKCLKCEADCPVEENIEYDCGPSIMTSAPVCGFIPSPLWSLGLLGLLDFNDNSRGNILPFIPFNPNNPNVPPNIPGPPVNPPNNPNIPIEPNNPDTNVVPEPSSYIVMGFIAMICLFIVKNKEKDVQVQSS